MRRCPQSGSWSHKSSTELFGKYFLEHYPNCYFVIIIYRVAVFIYLPACNMLTHAYKSNLLASLVKKEYEQPVDTFEDLLKSDAKLFIPSGTSVPYLMSDSPRKVVRDVYQRMTYLIGYNSS